MFICLGGTSRIFFLSIKKILTWMKNDVSFFVVIVQKSSANFKWHVCHNILSSLCVGFSKFLFSQWKARNSTICRFWKCIFILIVLYYLTTLTHACWLRKLISDNTFMHYLVIFFVEDNLSFSRLSLMEDIFRFSWVFFVYILF